MPWSRSPPPGRGDDLGDHACTGTSSTSLSDDRRARECASPPQRWERPTSTTPYLTPGSATRAEVDGFVPLDSEIRLVRLVERLWGDVDHPSVTSMNRAVGYRSAARAAWSRSRNWDLCRLQLATRLAELEPFDAVDLGEGLHTPRPGRHSIWHACKRSVFRRGARSASATATVTGPAVRRATTDCQVDCQRCGQVGRLGRGRAVACGDRCGGGCWAGSALVGGRSWRGRPVRMVRT
jgi:hypothetical protein